MTNNNKAIKKHEDKFMEKMNLPEIGDLFFYSGSLSGRSFIRLDKIFEGKYERRVVVSETTDGVNWTRENMSFSNLKDYYKKLHLSPGETYEEFIAGIYKDRDAALLDPSILENETDDSDTDSALVPVGGRDRYEESAKAIMKAKARVEIITSLAKQRAEEIYQISSELSTKLRKVMRVLGILEVYLGVHEEIFQITEGTPAPESEPITIRQRVLFMDEEVAVVEIYSGRSGITYSGDINFQSVHLFDEWLLKDNNIDQILPEKKGVIALRPSRQNRYDDLDPISKLNSEAQDKMTYLLIRNGENLYRVWTDIMGVTETFFPTQSDNEAIAKLLDDDYSWNAEEAEKEKSIWIRNMLLIQGLADRTQVFSPVPDGRIEFTNPETYNDESRVRLIRDGEGTLSDGHISFKQWRDKLAESTERGTRVYFQGVASFKQDGSRFDVYQNWYPSPPAPGIYTVEEVARKDDPNRKRGRGDYVPEFRILYLPPDPVWSRDDWNDTERRRRYSFWIFADEFINYDNFDLENVDYFLKSREERRNYREIMPLLIGLRKDRLAEIQAEQDFAKLIIHNESGISEDLVFECIEWWKRKVINKRPLTSDDAKAWRMILKEAKNRSNK
jgi:hypothetical protein